MQCWGTEEEDDGDPPRLWAPNAMFPGTAFTRSLGDTGVAWAAALWQPSLLTQGCRLLPGCSRICLVC